VTTATDFDAINYFRSGRLVGNPFPYWDYLRAQSPVLREPHHGVFMVTGYEEAVAVFHDHATFSSCNGVSGPFAEFPVPLEGDDISAIIEEHRDALPFSDQLPTFDPPKHTAHRALLMRLITPKRLNENEEFMWRLADRQIDEIHRKGECEFISEYAQPFTLLVVADLLGVPEEDHESFRAELATNPMGVGSKEPIGHRPLEFLYDRFTAYIEDRRRNPRDDVMTGLATATFPDGTIPDVHDVALIAGNLFAAGQETTARLLSFALQVIGERPDLQQLLRDDRARIPNFIEETLRMECPLKGQFRLARVATTVGGVEIPAGSTVLILPGAANRDPRVFAHPDEFDVDRPNARQHLAFGHGIHSCAGSPLARSEGRVSLERILDRMADIRISESAHGPAGARAYRYIPTYFLRGLEALHLEYTPVG
jgi:cytochrome P450